MLRFIIITVFLSLIVLTFGLAIVQAVGLGDAFNPDQSPLKDVVGQAGYDTSKGDINIVIGQIITIALSFLGVVFLVLMVYGGYLWMTARGKEEQVNKAKELITAAVIGLVIVIGAYALSWFIINVLGSKTLVPSQ